MILNCRKHEQGVMKAYIQLKTVIFDCDVGYAYLFQTITRCLWVQFSNKADFFFFFSDNFFNYHIIYWLYYIWTDAVHNIILNTIPCINYCLLSILKKNLIFFSILNFSNFNWKMHCFFYIFSDDFYKNKIFLKNARKFFD